MEVAFEDEKLQAEQETMITHEANGDETPEAQEHKASAHVTGTVEGENEIEMPVQTPVVVRIPQQKEGSTDLHRPHNDVCDMLSTVENRAESSGVEAGNRSLSSREAARNLRRSSMSAEPVLAVW